MLRKHGSFSRTGLHMHNEKLQHVSNGFVFFVTNIKTDKLFKILDIMFINYKTLILRKLDSSNIRAFKLLEK